MSWTGTDSWSVGPETPKISTGDGRVVVREMRVTKSFDSSNVERLKSGIFWDVPEGDIPAEDFDFGVVAEDRVVMEAVVEEEDDELEGVVGVAGGKERVED